MTNVEGLTVVLGRETEGYEKLIELADKKRQIIVDRDLEGLESSALEEQRISDELKSLERQRIDILKSFTDDKDLVPTVSQVIEALPEDGADRKALEEAKEAVVRAAGRMRFLNTQNKM